MLKMAFQSIDNCHWGRRGNFNPTLILPSQLILPNQKFKCKSETIIILEILENKIIMVTIKIVDGLNKRRGIEEQISEQDKAEGK